MKKILTIFAILIAMSTVNLFAQESQKSQESDEFFKVNVLLKNGLFKNENEISSLAANLSSSEKEFLYLENKKSPTLPFCLNLFLGYGIGSFVQGDTTIGVISLSGNLLGSILMFTGYTISSPILAQYNVAVANGTGDSFDWEANSGKILTGGGLILVGSVIALGVQIYSWIRPFKYADNYNLTLRKCLLSEGEKLSVQFAPIVDIDNSKYGLLASLKI